MIYLLLLYDFIGRIYYIVREGFRWRKSSETISARPLFPKNDKIECSETWINGDNLHTAFNATIATACST